MVAQFLDTANSIDAHIYAQPGADDLSACDEWLRSFHSLLSNLAYQQARSEALFCTEQVECLDKISAEHMKVIKGSSTLVTAHVSGLCPEVFAAYRRLTNLLNVCRTIADDTRTVMASYRSQQEIERQQVRQTIPPPPTIPPKMPISDF